jgi:LPXTG-motif cell wall-anchored protein
MTSTLSTGRRWAAALATAVLAAALTVPTIALGAPAAPAGGPPECINTEPALGEGKTDGNQGNEGAHGAVGCEDDENGVEDGNGNGDSGNGGENGNGGNGNENGNGGNGDETGTGTGGNGDGNGNGGNGGNGDETGTGGEEQDPAEGRQPAATTLPGDWCDATTVTFLPGQPGTHDHAVALTAQAIEQGVPGWEHITWAATDRASVRAVAARHADAVTILTDGDLSTGTLDDVQELLVCAEIADPQGAGTTTSPGGDDEVEVLGLVLTRTDGDDPAATDVETAVLGVTLLADTGIDAGWLAVAGAFSVLAGGGVLAATRRRGAGEVA